MGIPIVAIGRYNCLTDEIAQTKVESILSDEFHASALLSVYRVGAQVMTLTIDTLDPMTLEYLGKQSSNLSAETLQIFGSRKRTSLDGFDAPLMYDADDWEE